MSRIAKNPIVISKEIECNFSNGIFSAKGKLGQIQININPKIQNINGTQNSFTIYFVKSCDRSYKRKARIGLKITNKFNMFWNDKLMPPKFLSEPNGSNVVSTLGWTFSHKINRTVLKDAEQVYFMALYILGLVTFC